LHQQPYVGGAPIAFGVAGAAGALLALPMPIVVPITTAIANALPLATRLVAPLEDIKGHYPDYLICRK
jgi:hypothetical protein